MCFEQNSHSFRVAHFRLFDDFRASLRRHKRRLKDKLKVYALYFLIIFASQYCGLKDDLQAPFFRPEKSSRTGLKKGVFQATWEDVFSTSKRRLCVCWDIFKGHVKLVKICMVKFNVSILNRIKTINFF